MEDKSVKYALNEFLLNRNENFEDCDIAIEPLGKADIVDAIYGKTNEKFQVKRVPKDEIAVVNILNKKERVEKGNFKGEWKKFGNIRTKTWIGGGNIFDIFIKEPLQDLVNQYGPKFDFKDIICLLHTQQSFFPELSSDTGQEQLNKIEELKNVGFKEIYIVDNKKNVKIYPNYEIKLRNKNN